MCFISSRFPINPSISTNQPMSPTKLVHMEYKGKYLALNSILFLPMCRLASKRTRSVTLPTTVAMAQMKKTATDSQWQTLRSEICFDENMIAIKLQSDDNDDAYCQQCQKQKQPNGHIFQFIQLVNINTWFKSQKWVSQKSPMKWRRWQLQ